MKKPCKIKICGMKRIEDIKVVNALYPSYVGFVFAPSKRQITKEQATILRAQLHSDIATVGVFVNHSIEDMVKLVNEGIIHVIQLHGNEEEEVVTTLKKEVGTTNIIKAISVTSIDDILSWQDSKADYLLLDNGAGGSGTCFDWSILEQLPCEKKPFFLAGGLNPMNVEEVLQYEPYGVDVSSGVELDGHKDARLMTQFIEKVRTV